MLQTRMEIFRNAGATPTPKSHTSCDAASESYTDARVLRHFGTGPVAITLG